MGSVQGAQGREEQGQVWPCSQMTSVAGSLFLAICFPGI